MVIAIKKITSHVGPGLGVNVHNFEDGTDINFSGNGEANTNTWVPYQGSRKQVKIHIKDENRSYATIAESYVWDDNYKLQCSTSAGIQTLLTVSGSSDIGLNVYVSGVQAYFV